MGRTRRRRELSQFDENETDVEATCDVGVHQFSKKLTVFESFRFGKSKAFGRGFEGARSGVKLLQESFR